jgi:threonine synthase
VHCDAWDQCPASVALYNSMDMDTLFTGNFSIVCIKCGKEHTIRQSQSFCTSCGYGFPLEIRYHDASRAFQLPDFLTDFGLCAASSLLPLFGISERYNANIYAKCEQELPTGSFKHRGSKAEVLTATAFGYSQIVCASTGNMGVSLAALCARHRLPLTLFVPKNTFPAKLAAARKYGATIRYVDGAFTLCEREAAEYAHSTGSFLAGDYYLRAEGAKMAAGEILEQLNGIAPDIVIVPCGVGTNAGAIMKGFDELASGGVMDKIPQLCVVQSEKCCPIIDSLELGVKMNASRTDTLCSATAVADPYDYVKVKKYIDLTDGFWVRVPDEQTVLASKELAEYESIDCELSGAMPIAALEDVKDKISGKTIVLVVTGAGYKDISVQEEALYKILNK